jgi:hypothetical protein
MISDDFGLRGRTWINAPHPFSANFLAATYRAFDTFIDTVDDPGRIERDGRAWIEQADNRLRFSGYFKPYYRVSGGGPNKDSKHVLQVASSYLDFAATGGGGRALSAISPYAQCLLGAAHFIFSPFADHIRRVRADAYDRLRMNGAQPSLAVRLIRYEGDALAGTNLHVDKTALSCIVHASDWGAESRLVLATDDGQLVQAGKIEGAGVAFYGAALKAAGYAEFSPVIHAIKAVGIGQRRHSVVLFWLLPGVDLSAFSTRVETPAQLAASRRY